MKGQAWEAEHWENAVMHISGYRQHSFTDWRDKGTEPAWLSTGNRAQRLELEKCIQYGVSLFFSVVISHCGFDLHFPDG